MGGGDGGEESIQDNGDAEALVEDDASCINTHTKPTKKKRVQEAECSSRPPTKKRFAKDKPKGASAPRRGRKRKSQDDSQEGSEQVFGNSEETESERDAVIYMTKEDKAIRDLDMPERLQGLGDLLTVWPNAGDDVREAEWIYSKMFELSENRAEIVPQIVSVLEHLLVSKFEVPFIGGYCKDECNVLVEESSDPETAPKLQRFTKLWDVLYWHKKWVLLQHRKNKSKAAYTAKDDSEIPILELLLESLAVADSEQAINDVDAAIAFRFAANGRDGFKRPKRSLYNVFKNAGIGRISKCFGLESYQLADNVQALEQKHDVQNDSSSPEDLAAPLIGGRFQDAKSVLAAARHMVATEICMEPGVCQCLRTYYFENATITTKPTLAGTCSDSSVKWLAEKPLDKFSDAQWLFVEQAEKEGLITVTVNFSSDIIVQRLEATYLSQDTSDISQLWNEQRKLVLQEALKSLIQTMEKDVRIFLAGKARRWIASKCEDQLWKLISTAPYYVQDDVVARVAACCWGSGKLATTFVMLDASGTLVDTFATGYLGFRTVSNEQKQREGEAINRLVQFMEKHSPNVVVVEACNTMCRRLYDTIKEATARISAQTVDVVYGNAEIAAALENSPALQSSFPKHTGIVRRAIALGRYIQSPLAALTWLFSSAEKLPMKLHPLQKFISSEESYEVAERVLVTAASQVGLDINLAVAQGWHFGPLQYLPGLGPQMSEYIQRAIQDLGKLRSREELKATELVGMKVFTNAAAFIRVRNLVDPLDDTRIHPDSYEIARKVAKDACFQASPEMSIVSFDAAVEHVRKTPDILRNFDINIGKYRSMLKGGNGVQTLEGIKAGLVHGYVDTRSRYEGPTEEEVFFWLTKESSDVLGKIATVSVRNITPKGAMCILESGTLGMLPKDKLPLGVTEGSFLKCFVTGINLEFANLELTVGEGDEEAGMKQVDDFYKPDEAYISFLKEETRRKNEEEADKKALLHRPIVHEFFSNKKRVEAVQVLDERDTGSFMFIPSVKGPSFLRLLLKIGDGLYVQEDVLEARKDSGILQLGRALRISDKVFGSLDEIAAGFIQPFMSNLRTIMKLKRFKDGSSQEIEEHLRAEKSANPEHVPYYFSHCRDAPGKLLLAYLTCIRLQQELVGLSAKGYVFRGRTFDSPEQLASFFKKNMEEIPEPKETSTGRGCHNCGEEGHISRECPTKPSGGGRACHNCGEEGHISRECPTKPSGGGRACHNCGEEGHISRECPTKPSGGGRACHNCGEEGHISRECPTKPSGGGRACHNCGEEGHISRECPTKPSGGGRACHNCGEDGHISRECPTKPSGGGRACHNCGEEGHISRECPTKPSGGGRTCHNCGEEGHISRECPTKPSGGKGCFNCGELGHISRECPTKSSGDHAGGSSRVCYRCGEQGHISRDCPGSSAAAAPSNIDWDNNTGVDIPGSDWGNGTGAAAGDDGWGDVADGSPSKSAHHGTDWCGSADQTGCETAGNEEITEAAKWSKSGDGAGEKGSCFSCGELGHISRECPSKKSSRGSCFSCGEEGHISRECPSKKSSRGSCFNCGEEGHMSRECPRKNGSCFNCGQEGHMSRECPTKNSHCPTKNSGQSGWKLNDPGASNENNVSAEADDGWGNPEPEGGSVWGFLDKGKAPATEDEDAAKKGKAPAIDDGWGTGGDSWGKNDIGSTSNADADTSSKGVEPERKGSFGGNRRGACFSCGEQGHNSRECPSRASRRGGGGGGGGKCYSCGDEGHMSRDCPNKSSRVSTCFSCGEEGHISRECPTKSSWSGGGCFSCGDTSHLYRDCPKRFATERPCYHCREKGHLSRHCPSKTSQAAAASAETGAEAGAEAGAAAGAEAGAEAGAAAGAEAGAEATANAEPATAAAAANDWGTDAAAVASTEDGW